MTSRDARLPVLAMFGALGVLGGLVGWVMSGLWKLAVLGLAVFLACAIIGAALDSQRKG